MKRQLSQCSNTFKRSAETRLTAEVSGPDLATLNAGRAACKEPLWLLLRQG
jgi:hypothetical protein